MSLKNYFIMQAFELILSRGTPAPATSRLERIFHFGLVQSKLKNILDKEKSSKLVTSMFKVFNRNN